VADLSGRVLAPTAGRSAISYAYENPLGDQPWRSVKSRANHWEKHAKEAGLVRVMSHSQKRRYGWSLCAVMVDDCPTTGDTRRSGKNHELQGGETSYDESMERGKEAMIAQRTTLTGFTSLGCT